MNEKRAFEFITAELIDLLIIWQRAKPKATKAFFEITAPRGTFYRVEFVRIK